MALIESLRLNKGEQQDAAEFSKLFLEMITNELLKQKDLKLRGLTKELVCISDHVQEGFDD
jgi:ubiquitin carboxyl-terminal hydrolase 48